MSSSSDDDFLDDMPELESSTNGSGSGTKTLADSLAAQVTSSGWLNIVFVALLEMSSSFDDDFLDDVLELGCSAGCSGSGSGPLADSLDGQVTSSGRLKTFFVTLLYSNNRCR